MRYSTETRYGFTAAQQRNASRKTSLQVVVGNVALACVALTCAWTVYANVAGPSIATAPTELPMVKFVPHTSVAALDVPAQPVPPSATFSERFLARSDDLPESRPALAKADRLPIAAPQQLAEVPQVPEAAPVPDLRQAAVSAPPPVPDVRQIAQNVPLPTPRPAELQAKPSEGPSRREATQANKAAVLAAISAPKPSIFERLFGKQQSNGPTLAFASPDGGITSDGQSTTPGRYDKQTAVYDISARTVYMPDGTKLEAHSGLGSKLDDPRFVHVRMHGATPPHTYDLSLRESLFHGVQALRLNPVGGEGNVYGRTGLLAHTFMLGPNGDSNGCVSFRDYQAFLRAYKNNEVKRLVVVAKLD